MPATAARAKKATKPTETIHVSGVELAAVGVWDASTGETAILSTDLGEIVRAYTEQQSKIRQAIPVRLGHDAGSYDDSAPAAGWVANLRVEGAKLVGDMDLVADVAASVKAGEYGPRSVGIAYERRFGDAVYPVVLDHVALLGAANPAIANLNDLASLFSGAAGTGERRVTVSFATRTQTLAVRLAALSREIEQHTAGKRGAPALRAALSQLSALAEPLLADGATPADDDEEENEDMELSKIREALGIGAEDDILAAIAGLKGKADAGAEATASLSRADQDSASLRERVLKLESDALDASAAALVEEFKDRIPPAGRDVALAQARRDPKGARTLFASLGKFVDLGEKGSAETIDFSSIEPTPGQVAYWTARNGGRFTDADRRALLKKNAKEKGIALPENFALPAVSGK